MTIPVGQRLGLAEALHRRVYNRSAPSDVVLCDVDGVLADFSSAFSALVASKFPELSLTHTSEVRDWYWKEHGWTAEHFAWGWRQVRAARNWWERVKPLASPEVFARIAALHTTAPIILPPPAPAVAATVRKCRPFVGLKRKASSAPWSLRARVLLLMGTPTSPTWRRFSSLVL